ncbi:MAG: FMN-binding negative transcriptional regulator [Anaerolineales bacterium]|nr:FMN-binding negative transcriptional regulator [Anaerolineales bacterium]
MYVPQLYSVTDDAIINDFIRQNNFAVVVSTDETGVPVATHLPLELTVTETGERRLAGHFAKANAHWRALMPEKTMLVIFSGPHTYISPRWYDQPNVPTWNYMTVHAYGHARLIEDEAEVLAHLTRMVNQYEAQPGTYKLEEQPPKVIQQMHGVVMFEMVVTRVEAKFKLSQNRNAGDYANIIAQLQQREDALSHQVAEAMGLFKGHG